jgi:membrane-associated phospholipid phosphatase
MMTAKSPAAVASERLTRDKRAAAFSRVASDVPLDDDVFPVELDARRRAQRAPAKLVILIFVSYMAVAIGLYVWRGASFTPDRWLVFLLVGALLMGRALAFLRDWIPVVLLIAGYEFMRKLAGQMVAEQDRYVHVTELIQADRAVFLGHIPTIWLQERYYDPGQVHWYDYVVLLVYALHFVFPLAFAFMLWLTNRERFWQFVVAFLIMTYAAFAFFLYYPAAPPWFADRYGYIEGVQWPAGQAFQAMVPQRYNNYDTFKIWDNVSGNAVAAMPSLHAAFPWLVLLFAVKFYGRRGLWFLPYSPILWFSIVYLGHHWVVDVMAGVAWATVCFIFIQFLWPWAMRGAAIPVPRPLQRAMSPIVTGANRLLMPIRAARRRG